MALGVGHEYYIYQGHIYMDRKGHIRSAACTDDYANQRNTAPGAEAVLYSV